MAADAILGKAIGVSGTAPMAARVFGGSTQKARQEGASLDRQLAYGTGSAALSLGTEMLSNMAGPFRKAFGKGFLDDAISNSTKGFGQSTPGRVAISALSEGGEELVEDFFQPILQRATYDKDASFDLKQALYDAAIGATLGGVGGAVDVAGKSKSRTSQSPIAELQRIYAQKTGIGTEQSLEGSPPGSSGAIPVGKGGARERAQFSPRTAETELSGLCDDAAVRDQHAALSDLQRRQEDLARYEDALEWTQDPEERRTLAREILEAREDLAQYGRDPAVPEVQRLQEDLARYEEELEWSLDPAERSFWEEKIRQARTALEEYGLEDLGQIQEQDYDQEDKILVADPEKDGIITEEFTIPKSLGAKAKNYPVYDPFSGEYYYFVEGTRIKDPKVFAGKGGVKKLRDEVAQGLSEQIGGKPSEWQHCKGIGIVDCYGKDCVVEVHWFQEPSVGKHRFSIKKWFDK